jgi:Ca2+-binding EF-hand superfamily protein
MTDKDKNGVLSYSEIQEVLKDILSSDEYEETVKLLKKLDADGNQQIEYSEFINMTLEHKKLLSRQNLEITFKNMDADGSGTLDLEELRKIFEAGGKKRTTDFWRKFIASIDQNNDGVIDLNEFINGMVKLIDN